MVPRLRDSLPYTHSSVESMRWQTSDGHNAALRVIQIVAFAVVVMVLVFFVIDAFVVVQCEFVVVVAVSVAIVVAVGDRAIVFML